MSPDDAAVTSIDRIDAFLRERIGLRCEGSLRGRLRRSVHDEAAARGEDLDAFVEAVCRGGERLDDLVNRLTVQESGFFRHPEHFDVLADSILPALDRPVRIWSAACGNGQEAYSLAMLLAEHGVAGSVVASDLSTEALARTTAAWYSLREINGISPPRRLRYLTEAGTGWQVTPQVQSRVTCLQHNLVDAVPSIVASCQVVLCRNVLIYLSARHARAFLDRLADALAPGAYLLVGAAESLWQLTERFQPVRLGGAFVYRRREVAADRRSPIGLAPVQPAPPPVPPALQESPVRTRPSVPRVDRVRRLAAADRQPPAARPTSTLGGTAPLDEAAALEQTGKLALAGGDYARAVVIFRKCAYLAPDNPMGAFHLGLALEADGHPASARRAFAVARAALADSHAVVTDGDLEGFAREELVKLLEAKQAAVG